ncbi:MAG: hypothetical protein QXS34_05670 [Desulfurococcaceae archaeon]
MNREVFHKVTSIPLLVLVALSLLVAVTPLLVNMPVVYAARGNPRLAALHCQPDPSTGVIQSCDQIIIASSNVSVRAGEMFVEKVDGVDVPTPATGYYWYFTIVFVLDLYQPTEQRFVSFDGAQFDLYISKDGYSALSPDDIMYARPFYLTELFSPLANKTIRNPVLKGGEGMFHIGIVTGPLTDPVAGATYQNAVVVVGPIPFDITVEYRYIKVFDGTATAVAVTQQTVDILGSIDITPRSGPGGALVTIRGVALRPNALVNITYTGVTYTGATGIPPENVTNVLVGQVWTDAQGRFTYTFRVIDLLMNWVGTNTSVPYADLDITVLYNISAWGTVGTVSYREYARAFVELRSVTYDDVAQRFVSLMQGSGNASLTVNVYVFDTIVVAGSWWNPADKVKFYIGTTLIGEATVNATGFFNATLTVPELSVGIHTVRAENAGVYYTFNIYVNPTMIVIPTSGRIGDTVEVRVYGFPANTLVGIWWEYECPLTPGIVGKPTTSIPGYAYVSGLYVNVANGTTGPDGRFNVTVTFTVPFDAGGLRLIVACANYWNCTGTPTISYAYFRVLPKLAVTPAEFPGDGRAVSVTGTGLDDDTTYTFAVDNQLLFPDLRCDSCGRISITLFAAGFRPGVHAVALYENTAPATGVGNRVLRDYITFRVVCTGDTICESVLKIDVLAGKVDTIIGDLVVVKSDVGEIKAKLSALEPVITEIRGNVATLLTKIGTIEAKVDDIKNLIESGNAVLTAIKGDVAEIKTTVGDIRARITALEPVITEIRGNVATLLTRVGAVEASVTTIRSLVESGNAVLTAINGTIATIKTDVGDIKADLSAIKPTITSISGDVVTIKTAVGDIKADVSAIKPVVTDIKDGVAKIQTAVGELTGVVERIDGNVATIKTDVGTIKADVSDVKGRVPTIQTDVAAVKGDVSAVKDATGTLPGLSAAIWVAVVFSIISAALAAFTVITVRRKIAG